MNDGFNRAGKIKGFPQSDEPIVGVNLNPENVRIRGIAYRLYLYDLRLVSTADGRAWLCILRLTAANQNSGELALRMDQPHSCIPSVSQTG